MTDSSTTPEPSQRAHEHFVRALFSRGIAVERMTEQGHYVIDLSGDEFTVNLDNLSREYARDGDSAIFENFVTALLADRQPLPAWAEAKGRIRYIAESSKRDLHGVIHDRVTDSLCRLVAYVHPEETGVRWLTDADLLYWMIQGDELVAAADDNSAAMLARAKLEVHDAEGCPLGFFDTSTPYKASLVFSPNLKEIVAPRVAWPIDCVVPCRDFLYLWPAGDQRLLFHMGNIVMQESRRSGYPLSTEVVRISDEGIVVVGRFEPKSAGQVG